MKILFHNYSNSKSTEPIYLHNALLQAGVESSMWDSQRVSAYDAFDSTKPDVFVTHYTTFTNDILTYLGQNKNCDVILNVTGATESQLSSISNVFKDVGVKCPLVFSNDFRTIAKSDFKSVTLFPAADVFNVSRTKYPSLDIPEAIISDNFSENVEKCIGEKDVFHLLYITEGDLDTNFDVRVNVRSLASLYKRYPKMTLTGSNELCCSQLFFDMVLSCNQIDVKSSDSEGFHKIMKEIFTNGDNTDDVQAEMKRQIKAKHTPFHRAWRLMKYLDNKEAMGRLDQIKSKLPEILKDI